jgi:hypothetical protein
VSALWFFAGRRYGVVVATVLAGFLGYSLSAWLGRTEPPTDMVDLAGDQLGLSIVAVAVGAALAATVSARHHRRAGRDLWVTAARSPLRLSATQFLAVAVPVLGGWLVYLGVTAAGLGPPQEIAVALLVQLMSLVAVATGVALGQLVGLVVPTPLAGPGAFVVAYLCTAFLAAAGDEQWWQWLGPGFGDGLSADVHAAWLTGEFLWFAGVTAALLLASSLVASFPRKLPTLPTVLTAAALLAGVLLLFVNGPDASARVVSS